MSPGLNFPGATSPFTRSATALLPSTWGTLCTVQPMNVRPRLPACVAGQQQDAVAVVGSELRLRALRAASTGASSGASQCSSRSLRAGLRRPSDGAHHQHALWAGGGEGEQRARAVRQLRLALFAEPRLFPALLQRLHFKWYVLGLRQWHKASHLNLAF